MWRVFRLKKFSNSFFCLKTLPALHNGKPLSPCGIILKERLNLQRSFEFDQVYQLKVILIKYNQIYQLQVIIIKVYQIHQLEVIIIIIIIIIIKIIIIKYDQVFQLQVIIIT